MALTVTPSAGTYVQWEDGMHETLTRQVSMKQGELVIVSGRFTYSLKEFMSIRSIRVMSNVQPLELV